MSINISNIVHIIPVL